MDAWHSRQYEMESRLRRVRRLIINKCARYLGEDEGL
jgi:hypothetical protein